MSGDESVRLSRNCEALADTGAPDLALAVRQAQPAAETYIGTARDGSPVPVVNAGNREIWLHSRYSPAREAERACSTINDGETVVALALAGGYHLRTLIARRHSMPIVVLPESPETLAVTLRRIDLSGLVSTPYIRIVDGAGRDRVLSGIVSGFVPLFCTGLSLLAPAGVSRAFARLYATATASISRAREIIAEDVTAQRRFGLLWMRNILLNLPAASVTPPPPRLSSRVTVAGAGPGLERWLGQTDVDDDNGTDIVATDTAWPALRRGGRTARFAVSVDPSPYTFHHLLCGGQSGKWLLDVGAAPILWRSASTVFAVRNRHPLVSLFDEQLAHLTTIVRGGDVSEVSVEIAAANGASEIVLRGTDYGYPAAQTYARGTYVTSLFESSATRVNSIDTLHFRLAFRSPEADRDQYGVVRTPGLTHSYDRMRSIASNLHPSIRVIFPDDAENRQERSAFDCQTTHEEDRIVQGDYELSKHRCLERIADVRSRMMRLHIAESPLTAGEYWASLDSTESGLVAALIPAALATKAPSWHIALDQARDRFVTIATTVLQRGIPG